MAAIWEAKQVLLPPALGRGCKNLGVGWGGQKSLGHRFPVAVSPCLDSLAMVLNSQGLEKRQEPSSHFWIATNQAGWQWSSPGLRPVCKYICVNSGGTSPGEWDIRFSLQTTNQNQHHQHVIQLTLDWMTKTSASWKDCCSLLTGKVTKVLRRVTSSSTNIIWDKLCLWTHLLEHQQVFLFSFDSAEAKASRTAGKSSSADNRANR